MSHLLRVALPDIPGSLGRVATAIGVSGGNIDAIEIVEHRLDGTAVDDVFLTLEHGIMPDAVVSACTALDGVQVLWISRYQAAGNIFMDLEVVEEMTVVPSAALDKLVDAVPVAFRVDWAARLMNTSTGVAVVRRTQAAPDGIERLVPWPDRVDEGVQFTLADGSLAAACPISGPDEILVVARRGGPEFLDSEVARLSHLTNLALSISRPAH